MKLLDVVAKIPTNCNKRLVKLQNILRTKLDKSECIYFSSEQEKYTIVCGSEISKTVTVQEAGKIKLGHNCQAYGPNSLIKS